MNAPPPRGVLLQAQALPGDAARAGSSPDAGDTGAVGEAVVITDAHTRIVGVNDAFLAASGYARDQLVGGTPARFASGRHDRTFYRAMWERLLSVGRWSGEVWNRRADGTLVAQRVRICAVPGEAGAPAHYVAVYAEQAQPATQDLPAAAVRHDPLTGLPSRALALERLAQLLADAQRQQRQVAVCFLDLDGFGNFNAWYGEAQSDALLMAAADCLRGCLRAGDTVARLDGDEFVLLLGNLQGVAAVQTTLERVQHALAQPYALSTHLPRVTASLGVALYPAHGDAPEALLHAADAAMYRARRLGRGVCLAGDGPERPLAQEALLEELRVALFSEQLALHYQPRVCARTRRVLGAEALVRWQHPRRGLLAASEFLPLAAGTPLEVELDLWVMRAAAAQRACWREAGRRLPLSLNIAPTTLALPDLAETVACLLADPAAPAGAALDVELEVPETVALDDLATASRAIKACARLGLGVALDDFGTGYASLGTMRRLPVAALKIDRSFVARMLDDAGDLNVVRAALGMAQAFGARAVAEGVQSEAQAQALADMGCAELQGFAIAPLMPAAALEAWLEGQPVQPGRGG
jgi:diguanylate cyclase (GGDEF)-like protein/PAS domain S-box-containing protein